ncbi:MAG TPA: hypothetical protein VH500_08345 [Nitrososphaeraceae archaeon]|jgi:hypothetical protein
MNDKTFITYLKKNGKILRLHTFVSMDDFEMDIPNREMIEMSMSSVSEHDGIRKSDIDILELKDDLKKWHRYSIDVKHKKLIQTVIHPKRNSKLKK